MPAYGEYYGIHPRCIVACNGRWKRVSDDADPFSGKSARVMAKRRHEQRCASDDNVKVLKRNPTLEVEVEAHREQVGSWRKDKKGSWICTARTKPLPKSFAKKRTGAKGEEAGEDTVRRL